MVLKFQLLPPYSTQTGLVNIISKLFVVSCNDFFFFVFIYYGPSSQCWMMLTIPPVFISESYQPLPVFCLTSLTTLPSTLLASSQFDSKYGSSSGLEARTSALLCILFSWT